jgi:hypothetical protein
VVGGDLDPQARLVRQGAGLTRAPDDDLPLHGCQLP